MKKPSLLPILIIGMVVLCGLLAWLLDLDWSHLTTSSIAPGGGILEGGIVAIATALVSLVLVTPFRAQVARFIRGQQQAPARRALFQSAVKQIESLRTQYTENAALFLLEVETAVNGVSVAVMGEGMERLKNLATALTEHLLRRDNPPAKGNSQAPTQTYPYLIKATQALSDIMPHMAAFNRKVKEHLDTLDKTFDKLIKFVPESAVQDLSKVRDELIRSIRATERMIDLCEGKIPIIAGVLEPDGTFAAAGAYLNTKELSENLMAAAAKCGPKSLAPEDSATLKNIVSDASWEKHKQYAYKLVELMNALVQQDHKLYAQLVAKHS